MGIAEHHWGYFRVIGRLIRAFLSYFLSIATYIVFSCKNISPKFLLLLLETERGWYEIKSHLSGSVRNSLSFDDLRDITLPLPKEDSLYIVQLFETIDKEISIKNKYLEKLKEQRKSLQQLLLTGIVRV